MKPSHFAALGVLNIFWAASYSSFAALKQFGLGVGQVVTLRYTIAAAVLAALWPILPGKPPRGRDLLTALVMGVIVFVGAPRLQVLGVHLGNAADASILMAFEPLITSVAAALFLRECVPVRRWLGFGLGLSGVLLLNRVWRPEFQMTGLTASAIFISAFLCEAAYSVLGKALIARAGLLKLLAIALLGGAIVNVVWDGPATLAAARTLPVAAWWHMGYLVVICTLVGYAVWYVVIQQTDVNLAILTIFIQPLAGVPIAVFLLGEPAHWGQLWGGLVIVAGLLLGLWRPAGPVPVTVR
jgi:drug/metabolite transporter (DMT)-like permease